MCGLVQLTTRIVPNWLSPSRPVLAVIKDSSDIASETPLPIDIIG